MALPCGAGFRLRRPSGRLSEARIPNEALAVLEALRLDGAGAGRLRALDDAGFRKVLELCDRAQLTLTLNYVCRGALPGWVQARIDKNLEDYSRRFERLEAALEEIADTLTRRGIEFVVLKGRTHSPEFTPDPLLRAQGDIDLWCSPESLPAAQQALLDLGYRPHGRSEGRHLPPMIRERSWEWRGDYFASDLPISVELHHRLWDEELEGFAAPGERGFWDRRAGRVLSLDDTLAFAALHLLMHLLHGDLRLQRAWEIANFLERHARDDAFWAAWREDHPPELRRLEAIIFQLVAGWFGAALSIEASEEIDQLPADVQLWLDRYALSPVEALFHPNKDEIWLHLCLVERFRDKCAVLRRRVLPLQGQTERLRSRFVHHSRALFPTLWNGVRWWWRRARLGPGYLRFEAASALFCLGMSVYFLLYNLYLLELGYREDVLGRVSSLMSMGTLLGALPAAAIARRIGLRNTLLVAMLGSAAAASFRVLNPAQGWLLASAFLNGLFMSLWVVSYSPTIAGLSSERNRQLAFSLDCAASMSVGILGGLAGGRLPGTLQAVLHTGGLEAKRTALLAAAAFAALGAWPAARLRFAEPVREAARAVKVYPRGRFLGGFLIALGCWSVAVGAFNPFFNAFFARLRMGTERIGLVYSGAKLFQVLAVLCAPLVFRRLGDVKGIAAMQLMTGLALATLAVSPAGTAAALAYTGYMSFQYMSEPGMFKMLMSRVTPGERSGASALYFLVTSIAASLSALAGGAAISRFGYSPTLLAAASIAALAALLFRKLM
jgi:predicted MFS family arabinose efflux permease